MRKGFEWLNIISSLIMSLFLVFVLYASFRYWTSNFPSLLDVYSQMFYVSVGIAIVTSISQWIEGRTKAIMKSFKNIKEENGRKKAGQR